MAKKLGDFFQIYVAFSEYLNFTKQTGIILYFLCTWHSSGRSSTVSSCSKCEDRRMSRSINQSCTPISLYSLGIKSISKLEGLDKFPIIKIGQTFAFNMVNWHACGAMDYVGGVGSEFTGKTFQAAQLRHEIFDHRSLLQNIFWYLPNWTSTDHQRLVEVQFGRYQKNILQELFMVVSCAAWNVFLVNSLVSEVQYCTYCRAPSIIWIWSGKLWNM